VFELNRKLPTAAVLVVVVVLVAGCVQDQVGKNEDPTLSDSPEAFQEDTIIVTGNNSSSVESNAANKVSSYIKQDTGYKPDIKAYSELSTKDRESNLIVVGTPNSNPMLEKVYERTNVTEVNETYPRENKGILEILRNPRKGGKVMLIVSGRNMWG